MTARTKPFKPFEKPIISHCLNLIDAVEKAVESDDREKIEDAIIEALDLCDGLGLDDEYADINAALLDAMMQEMAVEQWVEDIQEAKIQSSRRVVLSLLTSAMKASETALNEAAQETIRVLEKHTP